MIPMSTPTGIPIQDCATCGLRHPVTRGHCTECGRPTAFIGPDGICWPCSPWPQPTDPGRAS